MPSDGKRTYKLTSYEQYLIRSHEYRIITENQLLTEFVGNVVAGRLGINPDDYAIDWRSDVGELYTYPKKGENGKQPPTREAVPTATPTQGMGEKPKDDQKAGVRETEKTSDDAGGVQAPASDTGKSE